MEKMQADVWAALNAYGCSCLDTTGVSLLTHVDDAVCNINQGFQKHATVWILLVHLACNQLVEKLLGATHHLILHALTQHAAFLTGCAGCHLTPASLPIAAAYA